MKTIEVKKKKIVVELNAQKIYPPLEDLEVTPSGVEQNFKSSMYGYDNVKVKAVASDTLEVTPSKEYQQYIGLYGTVNVEAVDSSIDENIKAENIKEGINILGVIGEAPNPNEEETKTIDITENVSYKVLPTEGKALSEVNIDVATVDTMRKWLLNELTEYRITDIFEVGQRRLACNKLKKLNMSNLNGRLEQYFLYGCTNLEYIDTGNINAITGGSFGGIHSLTTVIMRNASVVSLNSTFTNANSIIRENHTYYCYFYVPKALVEEYKIATNWSTYAHRFRAIEDYPEEVNYDNY